MCRICLGNSVHVCRFCKGNISNHQVTVVVIVPPVAIFLAKHPSLEKYDLSSLKALASGGAPLKAEVINALKKRLPGTAMMQGYYVILAEKLNIQLVEIAGTLTINYLKG